MIILHLWDEKYGWESCWFIFTTSKNGLENSQVRKQDAVMILQWQSYKMCPVSHLHAKYPLWCWKSFNEMQYKGNKAYVHSVWKSPKKSHSPLRAKQDTFTFWMDKIDWKCQKRSILASFFFKLRFWLGDLNVHKHF